MLYNVSVPPLGTAPLRADIPTPAGLREEGWGNAPELPRLSDGRPIPGRDYIALIRGMSSILMPMKARPQKQSKNTKAAASAVGFEAFVRAALSTGKPPKPKPKKRKAKK